MFVSDCVLCLERIVLGLTCGVYVLDGCLCFVLVLRVGVIVYVLS